MHFPGYKPRIKLILRLIKRALILIPSILKFSAQDLRNHKEIESARDPVMDLPDFLFSEVFLFWFVSETFHKGFIIWAENLKNCEYRDQYFLINLKINLIVRPGKCLKCNNHSDDCRNLTVNYNPKYFLCNQWENSYWSEPSRDIQERELSRKALVSIVFIEI